MRVSEKQRGRAGGRNVLQRECIVEVAAAAYVLEGLPWTGVLAMSCKRCFLPVVLVCVGLMFVCELRPVRRGGEQGKREWRRKRKEEKELEL